MLGVGGNTKSQTNNIGPGHKKLGLDSNLAFLVCGRLLTRHGLSILDILLLVWYLTYRVRTPSMKTSNKKGRLIFTGKYEYEIRESFYSNLCRAHLFSNKKSSLD